MGNANSTVRTFSVDDVLSPRELNSQGMRIILGPARVKIRNTFDVDPSSVMFLQNVGERSDEIRDKSPTSSDGYDGSIIILLPSNTEVPDGFVLSKVTQCPYTGLLWPQEVREQQNRDFIPIDTGDMRGVRITNPDEQYCGPSFLNSTDYGMFNTVLITCPVYAKRDQGDSPLREVGNLYAFPYGVSANARGKKRGHIDQFTYQFSSPGCGMEDTHHSDDPEEQNIEYAFTRRFCYLIDKKLGHA